MGITFTSFQFPGASLVSQDHWQMKEIVKWALLPVLSVPLGGSSVIKLQYAAKQQKALGFCFEEKGKNRSSLMLPRQLLQLPGKQLMGTSGHYDGLPWMCAKITPGEGNQLQAAPGYSWAWGRDISLWISRLWPGPGRAALQQRHHHRCGLDLAIASPKYSSLPSLGHRQVLALLGEGSLQEWRTIYNWEKRIFFWTREKCVWLPVSPYWEMLQQVEIVVWSLVISIQVPCLSAGKGLTTQLCV